MRNVDIRVLGPLEVRVGSQRLDIAGKPAALLAVLLLNEPAAVSADRLVDALWETDPPRTARKTLQVHVSRLRKELPAGTVVSEGDGYALRVAEGRIDVREFRRLVEAGREARSDGDARAARSALDAALGLWRGPALAGVEGGEYVRTMAARLEDERLAAVELRIEAELELGGHAGLVGELTALVGEHPYREGFRRQLMLSLYRSGRQADALGAYQNARRTLSTELGLEPGPELRNLEAAMLRHDASLDPPPPRARHLSRRRVRIVLAATVAAALAIGAVAGATLSREDEAAVAAPVVRADSLVRIDARSGRVAQVTRVGRQPGEVAVGPGGAWVVNHRDRTVSRVSARGRIDTIGGVINVDHLAADADGVWVSGFEPTVARIDGESLEVDTQLGLEADGAEGLAVGGGHLWVTNPSDVRGVGKETVSGLDLRSGEVASSVTVGKTPIFTAFGYGSVWVANYDDDTLSVISPGSSRAETVRVCDGPLGLAAGFRAVWVVCYWTRELVRVDPTARRVIERIAVGAGPLDAAAGAGGVWVTNRDSGTVVKVSPRLNEVVRTIRFPAGLAPFGVAAGKNAVWVSVRSCPHPPCL